ncbi:ferritin family protein [Thermosphaera sp.]
MSYELIKKALDIEEKATASYFHSIGVLRLRGVEVKDLEEVIKKIAVETLIHKELMKGMLKAYEEALDKESQVMKELENIEPSAVEKALIVKLLKEHLIIESDMIATYKELAESLKYPVLKQLAETLAENERVHHELLTSLIKKYEE